MTDSNAIRDAITAIADTARPPRDIRAAVDARYRHYYQRRLILRTTGAVAVAGIGGVGVYRWANHRSPGFPTIVGGPGGGWLQAEPRWRPTWLPNGFGLTRLSAVVDGTTAVVADRTWTRPRDASEFLAVTTGWSETYASPVLPGGTRAVDVGGTRGELTTINGGVQLTWQAPDEPKLTVTVNLSGTDTGEERAIATKIARSLRRDADTIAIGPRPGWLPPDFATQPWMFSVSALDAHWSQNLLVRTAQGELSLATGPGVGLSWNTDGGRRIQLRGTNAWLGPDGTWLLAPRPDGTNVLASTTPSGADLARTVEAFDYGPVPDMTWYGTR